MWLMIKVACNSTFMLSHLFALGSRIPSNISMVSSSFTLFPSTLLWIPSHTKLLWSLAITPIPPQRVLAHHKTLQFILIDPLTNFAHFSIIGGFLTPLLVGLLAPFVSSYDSMISLTTIPATRVLFSKAVLHLAFHINQQFSRHNSHSFSCLPLSMPLFPRWFTS